MFYDLLIFIFMSYIKPQLIITTARCQLSYISYYSYIKPQLTEDMLSDSLSCISYYSYIKPQPGLNPAFALSVVYHTIPTSNHNLPSLSLANDEVVYHTIPTSNHNIVPLANIATSVVYHTIPTSNHNYESLSDDCQVVVYHTIPTSNHNTMTVYIHDYMLYIILFLHQTTTWILCGRVAKRCISYYSYIKPQPVRVIGIAIMSCISYYSYIKPQPGRGRGRLSGVVYHTIPTSNHNLSWIGLFLGTVVYHTIPTSNHNTMVSMLFMMIVVYHTIPTSNHNLSLMIKCYVWLYIILFLHQTTTCECLSSN